jgi:predicted ArsR family transcriptional regulator
MGGYGDPYYHVEVGLPDEEGVPHPSNKGDYIRKEVLNLITSSTVPISKAHIMETLGLKHSQVNLALDELMKEGKISANNNGYTVD